MHLATPGLHKKGRYSSEKRSSHKFSATSWLTANLCSEPYLTLRPPVPFSTGSIMIMVAISFRCALLVFVIPSVTSPTTST